MGKSASTEKAVQKELDGFLESTGCLILAGGKSRRFGRDKLELTLNGKTLTQIALNKYCSRFEHVILSTNHAIPARFYEQYDVPVMPAAESKGLSILYALEYFEKVGIDRIILAEAARPFTCEEHIDALVDLLDTGSNAVISGYPTWETIYNVTDERAQILPKCDMQIGQTPEGWSISTLKFAIQTNLCQSIDVSYSFAAVLGATDFTVDFCQGTRDNIKITYEIDALIARAIAKEHPDYLYWGDHEIQGD